MKFTVLVPALIAAAVSLPVVAQDAFPVTIEHGLGETVIESKPERIVTIGWMSQDVVLALGQVPVGIPLQEFGGDANGVLPWVADAVSDLGGELPVRLDPYQLPYEQILSLQPDLILAPYSDLDAEKYARLSNIAPTVAWQDGPWAGNWRDITRTIGRALGDEAGAEALIERVATQLADAAAAHPEFEDMTFTFGYPEPGSNNLAVYVSTDPRVQMIEDLGLRLSPGADALPTDGSFNVPVSFEDLESVDADILITWHDDQAELDALRANPVFARFRPVAEGRHLAIVDRAFSMATSAPSVLSIPWAIDRLVPQLAELAE